MSLSYKEVEQDLITISVGARPSALSRAQVKEVFDDLKKHHAHIHFDAHFIATVGDKDKITSLRHMEKNDFFTKELDDGLIEKKIRIAIHSAKDLPEPMKKGLVIVALTKGIDSADVLVMRQGMSPQHFSEEAIIATSSLRRETLIKELFPKVKCIDLRGTIEERLDKVLRGDVDGIVVAEAALIRLGLTHLNRVRLPGDTAPLQGQLAVIARKDDTEMKELFACIDVRNNEGCKPSV